MLLSFYLDLIPITTLRLCLLIQPYRSDTSRSSSLSHLKSKKWTYLRPSISLKAWKPATFFINSSRSFFSDVSEWPPDLENRCKPSSSFSSINLVELSALHNLETAVSEMFGPKFLMHCFTKLLLCSVDSSKGCCILSCHDCLLIYSRQSVHCLWVLKEHTQGIIDRGIQEHTWCYVFRLPCNKA